MVLKVCVHEWLSGGVSPCQGEGRGFESRLVLSMIQKRRYPLDTSFFVCSSPAGFERFEVYAPLRSSQQFQMLVKHKIAWYDKICSEMLVDGINPILLMTRRKVGSLLTS